MKPEVIEILEKCRDYMKNIADVQGDSEHLSPNEEMDLLVEIDEALDELSQQSQDESYWKERAERYKKALEDIRDWSEESEEQYSDPGHRAIEALKSSQPINR